MKQGYIMQLLNILLASQKTDMGERNDSGLRRFQNQMCSGSYYLYVDTYTACHRYDRFVYSDFSAYVVQEAC
jgi:hypothetical protein